MSTVRVRTNFTTANPNDLPSSLGSEQPSDSFEEYPDTFRSLQPLLNDVFDVEKLRSLLDTLRALNEKCEALCAAQNELVTACDSWVWEEKHVTARRIQALDDATDAVEVKNTALTFRAGWELVHDGIYESDRRTRELTERCAAESACEEEEAVPIGKNTSSKKEIFVNLINILLFSLIIVLPIFAVPHS